MTPPPIRTPLRQASLIWEGGAPQSAQFGDVYFSGDGPAESAHVFLDGNDLARRFATAARFAIGELGFGSGLNILMAWDLWTRTAKPPAARLHVVSVEAFPLSADDMARAHSAWPMLAMLSARLRDALPPPVRGTHARALAADVSLTLHYGAAGEALAKMEGGVDAWFFDGFSPAKNPDMWRPDVFREAARLSNAGATFTTFTVAGEVRRSLADAGFAIGKRAGYGRKKEMLAGRIDAPARASMRAPWFDREPPRRLAPGARIAIIGAGIAGASLAHSAREAGLAPTLFEKSAPAAGASGNVAGLIMPRLDLGDSAGARFLLQAYLHTIRLLNTFDALRVFEPCGVLLGASDEDGRARHAKLAAAGLLGPDWLIEIPGGLLFPQAGAVDPPAFVRALIGDAALVSATATRVGRLDGRIAIETDAGLFDGFDAVVLANGAEAARFHEARTLPLARIAGQLDWFPNAAAPARALAFGPYAAPSPAGGLVIGATYDRLRSDAAAAPSRAATLANIEAVRAFAPEIAAALDPADARPRASVRCQTPDRLPIAGPAPDFAFYGAEYDDLRLGRVRAFERGRACDGVYLLTGLGSRGLVTAPLAAAMIVAEMTGAPSPVGSDIVEALHPARFFIRDRKRAVRR